MPKFIRKALIKLLSDSPKQMDEMSKHAPSVDPLDITKRSYEWVGGSPGAIQRTISDFPMIQYDDEGIKTRIVGDAKYRGVAQDDDEGDMMGTSLNPMANALSPVLLNWYSSQSFIGYQACAIIAQHWLVDKACSMSGEDAVRNGWSIKAKGSEEAMEQEESDILTEYDIKFDIVKNLKEFNRFKNIFGIRVLFFVVESDDPDYYEKPFNIDGITPGSYKGISQVDPYWMMPLMTSASTSDPADPHFYEPEFWVISGQKYHRSHLIIGRGHEPADILKPTYIFGGVSRAQQIYERVYAAERTANEAPLLAMNKRTTAIHVDVAKAMLNTTAFEDRLAFWIKYRDNNAVKVLGKDEVMEQFDTNLSDFDSLIMNQYQLVSAIAKTPATKLLGTSPKGFNATGDFETVSYHEELESIQSDLQPILDRHYLIQGKSLQISVDVTVVWESVDSMTAAQKAEINDKKADTDSKYVAMGSISPDEVRHRLRDDKNSGYNRLQEDDANQTPGMSPENIAAYEKAAGENKSGEGEELRGEAEIRKAGTPAASPNTTKATVAPQNGPSIAAKPEADEIPTINIPLTRELIGTLSSLLSKLVDTTVTEGKNLPKSSASGVERTSKPGTEPSIDAGVSGIGNTIGSKDPSELPKIKVGGMVISVENPRGSIRKGTSLTGDWQSKMNNHYGFIRGTNGADGEEIDCFVGPNFQSQTVFVINQKDTESKEFDEHKCMIGFNSAEEAKEAYESAYSEDFDGFESIERMTMEQFKEWLKSGDTQNPCAAAIEA